MSDISDDNIILFKLVFQSGFRPVKTSGLLEGKNTRQKNSAGYWYKVFVMESLFLDLDRAVNRINIQPGTTVANISV